MPSNDLNVASRRRFLEFLAGTPVLAGSGLLGYLGPRLLAAQEHSGERIRAAEEALNVLDFEAVAKANMLPAHYGYTVTGTDDEETLRANREGFQKFRIRVRRLVDIRNPDPSTSVFGVRWDNPIALAPVGGQGKYHYEGEIASARAARSGGHVQILSTSTSETVEDVTAARGAPIWFQLYPSNYWHVAEALVKRAEQAGCPVVALTVDRAAPRNMETFERYRRSDTTDCSACHVEGPPAERLRNRAMYRGIDLSGVDSTQASGLTWSFVERLKSATSMRVVLKGIVTAEDAELSVRYGADGIIVSNHGGRSEAGGRSTIESLPEIVAAVRGRVPVLIDGGFRRGTDIFKALALGADAVCVGRPYVWGLGAFGQAGVEKVMSILREEFRRVMAEAGVTSVDQIDGSYIEPA
ncbi:MAG TPA: alpha-hydroxy acid oxidase [Gammaproteobacteria bacterium]|jgi:isopentenyl diphosphate isomerase/L-lactate dehydrogenase-like FMN-dependent dehydrogenase